MQIIINSIQELFAFQSFSSVCSDQKVQSLLISKAPPTSRNMKNTVIRLLCQAVSALKIPAVTGESVIDLIRVERTRDSSHGDFACNLALKLAKPLERPPRCSGRRNSCSHTALHNWLLELIRKVEIAGPGFINFYFRREAYYKLISSYTGSRQ